MIYLLVKAELDRFCDALISIREEIAHIEKGKADINNNVLKVLSLHHSCLVFSFVCFQCSQLVNESTRFPDSILLF